MNYNKLIEDIMYKADEAEVPDDEDFCGTDFLADMDPRRVEIFAKMIIKECIYLVEKNKPDEIQRKEFPTDFIEGWENNSEVVIEDLMLHFGVEE